MTTIAVLPLSVLYEQDETAWLDATAELLRDGRLDQVDTHTLAEYLTDMAKRDRREVYSRLVVLLAHLLKWEYQPDHRSRSWQGTILEQRRELRQLLESGTLHSYAVAILADAYADARRQAAVETGLARGAFPEECGWGVDGLLTDQNEDA